MTTPNQVVVLAAMGDRRWHTVNDLCQETGFPYSFVRGCLGNFRLVGWVTAGKGTWKITTGGTAQLERTTKEPPTRHRSFLTRWAQALADTRVDDAWAIHHEEGDP